MKGRAGLCVALTLLAACSQPDPDSTALPVTGGAEILGERTVVQAPNGAMSLRFEKGSVTLSAGFLRQSAVGTIEVPSTVSWAPDSRRFFINDSGSASWSRFRLWSVNARARATESSAIHDAAVAELGRRNGCDSIPRQDATTTGMGWSPDGARVYVLAEVQRQTGACIWKGVDYIIVVADAATGRLSEIAQEDEARRRWPALPWAPVTAP